MIDALILVMLLLIAFLIYNGFKEVFRGLNRIHNKSYSELNRVLFAIEQLIDAVHALRSSPDD
jgi:hypothetical protein